MNDPKEYFDELQETPLLRQLKQSAPENPDPPDSDYFASFSSRMQVRLEDEEILAETPILQTAGRKRWFSVPEGYFQALPARIMALINAPKEEAKVRSLWNRESSFAWGGIAIAAVISLLLMFQGRQSQDQRLALLEEIPTDQLLAMAAYEVDDYALMEEFSAQNLEVEEDILPEGELEELFIEDLDMSELEALLMEEDQEIFD